MLDGRPSRALAAGFTLSCGLIALGWLLFGEATFWAWIYPRAAVVLVMVGAVLTWLPLPLSGVVSAWPWRGWALRPPVGERRSGRAARAREMRYQGLPGQ